MNQLPLRPNVCMLVFNESGKLFLGERKDSPGEWQFPQGGEEEQLTQQENVYKELAEELGVSLEKVEIVKKLRATHQYEWDRPPSYAKSKWRGQAQTFWLVKFTGEDSDIVLDRYDPEFVQWRWCTVMEVRSMADKRRMPSYVLPLREFEDYWMLRDTGIFDS